MKKIVSSLVLLAALLSTQAIGKTTTLVCNGCDRMEKRTLALEGGTGDYFIFDVVNRMLTHWSISGSYAQAMPLSADQAAAYNAVQKFYDATGSLNISGTLAISLDKPSQILMSSQQMRINELSGDGKATAFDVVTTPLIKEQALAQLTRANSINGFTNQVLMAFKTLENDISSINIFGTGIRIPVNTQVRVELSDGSSFGAEFDFNTNSFVYVKGSARDAVGNAIPEDAIAAAGGPGSVQKYYYPNTVTGHESGALGISHLNALGIFFEVPNEIAHSPWMLACTRVSQITQCSVTLR